ncbi:MAG TPA: ABC-2 family transporter protein [Opitutaceae bacterium]
MNLLAYVRIWLASIRYSVVRTMMFRFDFFLWIAVDISWMAVNLFLVEVMFQHVDSIAGWDKPEMILLVGTAMLVMRLFMTFFMTNLFSIDRSVREGTLDFYLAQPGNPLFMLATRRIELDGMLNSFVALGIVVYAAGQLGIQPSPLEIITYGFLVFCGLAIHFGTMVMLVGLAFWITRVQGIEGGYFALFDLSRLPRPALRGLMEVAFVYVFPAVIISNFPSETLIHGVRAWQIAWLGGIAVAWFAAGATFFHLGLKRYSSASS